MAGNQWLTSVSGFCSGQLICCLKRFRISPGKKRPSTVFMVYWIDRQKTVEQSVHKTKKNDARQWLDLYGDALYRFALVRVHNSFTAEDLVQETLLAGFTAYGNFSGKSSVKTWLTGILKHKIADYFRKSSPELLDGNLDDFAGSPDSMFDAREKWKIKPGSWGGDPKNIFQNKELLTVIFACLDELPPRLSGAYRMRELEGATTREICTRFHTKENNCWVILHRARMLLRRCLEVNWFSADDKEQ
jgi:RNA polymerase sigma-70 factor (ECF subfamily)